MCVRWHGVEEVFEIFVNQGVAANPVVERIIFGRAWKVPVNKQVGNLEKALAGGKFFNWITAVAQDSLLTVDVGDCGSG